MKIVEDIAITLSVDVMSGGTRSETITVPENISSESLGNLVRQKHELALSWRITDAPAEFRERIQAESVALRRKVIARWNAAVIRVLPRVIAMRRAEAEQKNTKAAHRRLSNAEEALRAANRVATLDSVARGVNTKFDIPNNIHHIGVSHDTWRDVEQLVERDERLPLGVM